MNRLELLQGITTHYDEMQLGALTGNRALLHGSKRLKDSSDLVKVLLGADTISSSDIVSILLKHWTDIATDMQLMKLIGRNIYIIDAAKTSITLLDKIFANSTCRDEVFYDDTCRAIILESPTALSRATAGYLGGVPLFHSGKDYGRFEPGYCEHSDGGAIEYIKDSRLYANGENYQYGVYWVTAMKVNLTYVNEVYWYRNSIYTGTNALVHSIVTDKYVDGNGSTGVAAKEYFNVKDYPSTTYACTLDVSSLSGEYYVAFGHTVYGHTSCTKIALKR